MVLVRVRANKGPARKVPDKPVEQDHNESDNDEQDPDRHHTTLDLLINYVEDNRNTYHVAFIFMIFILTIIMFCAVVARTIIYYLDSKYYVSHEVWAGTSQYAEESEGTLSVVKQIIITHTDTNSCEDLQTCKHLLMDLKSRATKFEYNFFVSSCDMLFEGVGWYRFSKMFENIEAIVVAFIGNFTEESPSEKHFQLVNKWYSDSIFRGYLDRSFTIIGKNITNQCVPTHLFEMLKNSIKWNDDLSD